MSSPPSQPDSLAVEREAIRRSLADGHTQVYHVACAALPSVPAASPSTLSSAHPASMRKLMNVLPGEQCVEITVRDKVSDRVESFRCDVSLLRSSMSYFEPLIAKQLQQQQHQLSSADTAATTKGSSTPPAVVTLKVTCEIEVFRWLLSWAESATKPRLAATNAVSIMLSSSFLGMYGLTESALFYVRDHLAAVLLSGVDMGCIPGDLLGRLCAVANEASVANCLYALYQHHEERHPNRSFVSALLRHWVAERLMLTPAENGSNENVYTTTSGRSSRGPSASSQHANCSSNGGGAAGTPNSTGTRRKGGDPFHAVDSTTAKLKVEASTDNGLRWCRTCAVLYDDREMQRLLAHSGAALASPQTTKEPLCPGGGNGNSSSGNRQVGVHQHLHSSATVASSGGGGGNTRIGARGERLVTHTPSRLLPRATPAGSGTGCRPPLEVPPYAGSSWRQDLQVELWAWRLVGATRYAVCRRCRRLVSLIDVAGHACSANGAKTEFVPAERFAGTSGGAVASGSADMQSLIRWFAYAAREGVYAEVGELQPVRCPAGAVRLMEAETIAVPESNTGTADHATDTAAATAAETDAVSSSTDPRLPQVSPSLSPPSSPTQRRRGSSAPALGSVVPVAWQQLPAAVSEVSAVGPAIVNGKPIASSRPGCPVDIDVENFHERDFFANMAEQLARLSESGGGSTGTLGANACPRLYPYLFTAPPQQPTVGGTSPRPSSTFMSGTSMSGSMGVARRYGTGAVIMGSNKRMAKPSTATKSKRRSTTGVK